MVEYQQGSSSLLANPFPVPASSTIWNPVLAEGLIYWTEEPCRPAEIQHMPTRRFSIPGVWQLKMKSWLHLVWSNCNSSNHSVKSGLRIVGGNRKTTMLGEASLKPKCMSLWVRSQQTGIEICAGFLFLTQILSHSSFCILKHHQCFQKTIGVSSSDVLSHWS